MADGVINLFVSAGLSEQKAKETAKNETLASEFKMNIEKVNKDCIVNLAEIRQKNQSL